jgi:xylulose-5-phosphate/fructose-6-phosphate phosphoketolase
VPDGLPDELAPVHAWWVAANYLSVGQVYLMANPLLREPLRVEHIKPRLLGHFGTVPGLNLLWAHLNRVIRARDQAVLYVCGPGHGGPAMLANAWLEGTYSERHSHVSVDERGLAELFRQFSFPGGVPSHAAPQTPGSIHEGGELGYSLAHAFGAAFDNPELVVCCVVGDGEAETGPAATGWHGNKFLDPERDGAVLPVLHLNGYKIAGPTVLARIPEPELLSLLRGYGWDPVVVAGDDPVEVHQALAAALDAAFDRIAAIWADARAGAARTTASTARPGWPMIVLRTPKGWTGPKVVDGLPVAGTWRAHQVPLAQVRERPDHLAQLENWLQSYAPDALFDAVGAPVELVRSNAPQGDRRMSATPHSNGGVLRHDLRLPPITDRAVAVETHGAGETSATGVLGRWLADVMRANEGDADFRVFGPDETASNRLTALFDVTDRTWVAGRQDTDDHLARDGRVMEVLSEHQCQGWLEGYLLTGRHGLFNCYEAFVHIVDSMFNQHAKWLKMSAEVPWRAPVSSLNYLLTSHVWRQDHNGFSHQDPGFLDVVANKKASVVRVYLPPDANSLLSVADHCLRSVDHVNVIVAGKQEAPVWLGPDEAVAHCARGLGEWEWASNDGGEPEVVLACAGDVPTLEILAAVDLLRRELPDLRVRVVNVVDLMRLEPPTEHPHGLDNLEYDSLFPPDCPTIFAFHAYPWLIHRLAYRRPNHDHLHVRGYKEEGTTTTPFDMVMRNDLDRFHLVIDVIDRVARLGSRAAELRQRMIDERLRCRVHATTFGEDPPDIARWAWPYG